MSKINEEIVEENASNEEIKNTIAQNIVFFRKRMNLTQTDLAKILQYSNKNISKWEQAETMPDIFTLKKLAKIFGISLDTLTNPITNESKKAIKTKSPVSLKHKIYILSLAISILFLMSCVTFFTLTTMGVRHFNPALLFLYILPFIDLAIFIFCCCVRKKVEYISLSLFGWLITLCFFVTFIYAKNIAYIFIIAAAYQILALAFAKLVNSGKMVKLNKILIKRLKREP